jgi:hypothetical protein
VSTAPGWREAVAEEVAAARRRANAEEAAADGRNDEAVARREARVEADAADVERQAARDRHRRKRHQAAEARFEAFLEAFDAEDGIAQAARSVVATLEQLGLASDLTVQRGSGEDGAPTTLVAAIGIVSPTMASNHATVEIVASADHPLRLLTVVQSQVAQSESETPVQLEELTEERLGQAAQAAVAALFAT